ncbi:hypothetical protein B296_00007925, partial [Ensete ventricosum]
FPVFRSATWCLPIGKWRSIASTRSSPTITASRRRLRVSRKASSKDPRPPPLFVTWKKAVNGAEPRLRGCIGTLEARCIINGFRDYALTRYLSTAGSIKS